jgi:hemoglobin/transferrin/lactoferrin receptor protein
MYWRIWGTAAGCVSMVAVMSGQLAAQSIPLEGFVITSTKTSEPAIDALSGTSSVGKEQMDQQFQADKASQLLSTVPGVTFAETASDTAQSINIRGLMDFGRVNVLIEGARQNFQRTGHNADGVFYIEPEMLKSVDITRGPTSTIYGSGAIGGVAAFSLLDADDILRPGETAAIRSRTRYTSNGEGILASETAAVKAGNFDVLGQFNWRTIGNYTDGSGTEIQDSGSDTNSGLVKARWRLAPGHQLAGTIVDYDSDFVNSVGSARRDTAVHNEQYTLGYTFARPDVPLVDFSANVYRVNTNVQQRRLDSTSTSDPAGRFRFFDVVTQGFDINNTSRFRYGNMKLALTYGVDGFTDTVTRADESGFGEAFTPGGERTAGGAFVQSKATFFDKLDLITALRYDTYELSGIGSGGPLGTEGERVSPKITLGYTPVKGITLFGTYAEGYRAPAITETLIIGTHPPSSGFPFQFLPNPNLRPEVAHNFEGGVNLKYDGIFKRDDAFRGRIVAFQNKVDDFIDPVFNFPCPPSCNPANATFQYQNVAQATLEGVEIEGMYDARSWFLGVAAQHIRGTNEQTGEGLYSVPADRVTLTAGFRAFDQRLIAGGRVHLVAAQDRVPEAFQGSAVITPSEAYTTVDLFGQYTLNDNAVLNVNVDNLLDVDYRPYLYQQNSPGLSARIGMTLRFGATPAETAAR